MAKGANGTIDISTQTILQREKIKESKPLKTFGHANQGRIDSIYTDSLHLESNRTGNLGVSSIFNGFNSTNTSADPDIYKAYSLVVDPSEKISGFGFSDNDKASLNYGHTDNPFVTADAATGVISASNYDALTTGKDSQDTGRKRRYLGFPDLAPAISDTEILGIIPTSNTEAATSGIGRDRTQSFGTTQKEARDAQQVAYPNDTRGAHQGGGGEDFYAFSDDDGDGIQNGAEVNPHADKIGKYFTNVYVTP